MTKASNLIAVASGKGGVGKTWLTVTLAQAAAKAGRRVVVLDGDIGLANVDIQIGVAPINDLSLWASGAESLAAILQKTPAGFDLIPGASGDSGMAALPASELARLVAEFGDLAASYDFGLIDIAAGVDPTQLRLAGAAGRCLLVLTDDPTSLTDAYAFVKLAQRLHRPPEFEIVANMAETQKTGERAYNALQRACKSFLNLEPGLAGVIRRDPAVAKAIRKQTPLMDFAPHSDAATDVIDLLAGLAPGAAQAA